MMISAKYNLHYVRILLWYFRCIGVTFGGISVTHIEDNFNILLNHKLRRYGFVSIVGAICVPPLNHILRLSAYIHSNSLSFPIDLPTLLIFTLSLLFYVEGIISAII